MKCCECSACRKGWFESQPDSYVCIGVLEPFVISDVNAECTEYSEKKTGHVKHKYLRELFPDGDLPFPYYEEDYHDFDERDTFNMNYTLIAWIYECLRYFQDEASKTIDLEFNKFDIDNEPLTQRQCIARMVEDCKTILLADEFTDKEYDEMLKDNKKLISMYQEREKQADAAKDDLFRVLSKVYWSMWW